MVDVFNRFWSKVDVKGASACWNWKALKTGNGSGILYGSFRYEGKMKKAHRVAYSLCRGEIPEGMVVRHKCDNGLCCNPMHLETGTQKQNVKDRYERGRDFHFSGELHPMAKLSNADVLEIKRKRDLGFTQKSLADDYGVSKFGIIYAVKRAEKLLSNTSIDAALGEHK